jgi:tetratricopeptide (TPR) repeat protein
MPINKQENEAVSGFDILIQLQTIKMRRLFPFLVLLFFSGSMPLSAGPELSGFLTAFSIQRTPVKAQDLGFLAQSYRALALNYAGAGDTERALEALEKAMYFGFYDFETFRSDHRSGALRQTPLWQKIDATDSLIANYLNSFSAVIGSGAGTKQKIKELLKLKNSVKVFPPELDVLNHVHLMPLGLLYYEAGEYVKAAAALSRGLDFELHLFGEEAVLIAGDYNYLGRSFLSLKDYDRALEVFRLSLSILDGLEVPPVVISIVEVNTGIALIGKEDFETALSYHRRALERDLESGNFEGLLNILLREYFDTLSAFKERLVFRRDRFNSSFSSLARMYYGLGIILMIGNNEELSSRMLLQAIYFDAALIGKIIGDSGLSFLDDYAWLLPAKENAALIESAFALRGKMLENPGALSDAEETEAYARIIALLDKLPPELSFLRCGPRLSQAYSYYRAGDYWNALEGFLEILEFENFFFPGGDPLLAEDYYNAALCYRALGKNPEADSYFEKARSHWEYLDERLFPNLP